MALFHLTLLAAAVASVSAAGSFSLMNDNFDTKMLGKNAFVKFQAPWWGHCKSLKPIWEELGDEYNADSSAVLIGDVDCTDDGSKDLCEKFGVSGYPTIKYFADGDADGKDYQGGRDIDSLKAHVEEHLQVQCDANDPGEGCSDKEKAYIEKMKAKTEAEQQAQLERLTKMQGSSMKAELKQWLSQRLRILNGLGKSSQEL